ncbi:hypothetical protein GGE12_005563 [Rhizobium mongolense]|uniref:Uncharacterized protein n=1 Tax=Rhizobium mongolense TaxID=57676 RepID=A0A7W6RSE4_9HYPH|nr:hypothetical protein [Rhizobium mongolense]
MAAAREHVIADLRARISALTGGSAKKAGCLPFEVAEIDQALPAGGWLTAHCMNLPAAVAGLSTELQPLCSLQVSLPGQMARSSGV